MTPRRVGFFALYLGLAVYGAWRGLIFIAWLGFAFAVAQLLANDRHRALVVSVAFLVGGLILVGEAFSWGLDVNTMIALVAGVFLAGMGRCSSWGSAGGTVDALVDPGSSWRRLACASVLTLERKGSCEERLDPWQDMARWGVRSGSVAFARPIGDAGRKRLSERA